MDFSPLLDALEAWSGYFPLLPINNHVGFLRLHFLFGHVSYKIYNLVSLTLVFCFDAAKRLSLLFLSAVLQGASVGPLIKVAIDVDPR